MVEPERKEDSKMAEKSWKPEVIADASGSWCSNALRFATEAEAFDSALALSMRWTMVRDFRATVSEDPVNYRRIDGRDTLIEKEGG